MMPVCLKCARRVPKVCPACAQDLWLAHFPASKFAGWDAAVGLDQPPPWIVNRQMYLLAVLKRGDTEPPSVPSPPIQ
jgi:hypothetical protein